MMSTKKMTALMLSAFLTVGGVSVAQAQGGSCDAGLAELYTLIGSKQGPTEAERIAARAIAQEASNANNRGDTARCEALVEQGKKAMGEG